jgi:hypothetical protein
VHSLLLCKSGKVYTCGKNEAGLLGTGLRGGPPFWSTPQLVEPLLSKHVRMVACGVRHSAAVGYDAQRKQTRLFTWGSNSHGQLGLSGVPLDAWVSSLSPPPPPPLSISPRNPLPSLRAESDLQPRSPRQVLRSKVVDAIEP